MTRSRSRTERARMSDEVLKARDIYKSLEEDRSFTLRNAHAKYREAFGISHDHGGLDQEYIALVRKHFGYPRLFTRTDADVSIPVRLALAFFLRESHGRKRKMSLTVLAGKTAQMEEARQLKARYMSEEHLSAEDAEVKAAEELQQTFEWRGRRGSLMTVDEMLEWFSHPGRYGLPSTRAPRR
jgi:hypothetical protein